MTATSGTPQGPDAVTEGAIKRVLDFATEAEADAHMRAVAELCTLVLPHLPNHIGLKFADALRAVARTASVARRLTAERERDTACEDAARLDWLGALASSDTADVRFTVRRGQSIREAIDIARAARPATEVDRG